MAKVKCDRCGKSMPRGEWESHKCEGLRDLADLPTDLLMKVATKQMTEEEAWAELDKESAK